MDQIKGRIKEAAGVLTDDDSLKNEGKHDQVGGEVKETAERVAEKIKETVAKGVEKVKDAWPVPEPPPSRHGMRVGRQGRGGRSA